MLANKIASPIRGRLTARARKTNILVKYVENWTFIVTKVVHFVLHFGNILLFLSKK